MSPRSAEIPTLEKVTVPMQAGNIEALRKLPRLQILALQSHRNGTSACPSTAEEFWKDYGWISRLRDSGFKPKTLKRLEDGTWEVDLEGTAISDLTISQRGADQQSLAGRHRRLRSERRCAECR